MNAFTSRQTASANTTASAIWPTLFLRMETRNSSRNCFGVSSTVHEFTLSAVNVKRFLYGLSWVWVVRPQLTLSPPECYKSLSYAGLPREDPAPTFRAERIKASDAAKSALPLCGGSVFGMRHLRSRASARADDTRKSAAEK